MLMIQLTGLSGAGKTSIAKALEKLCIKYGITIEVIDADEYRKTICRDLSFSKEDRCENIRRLGEVAHQYLLSRDVVVIAAINPYNETRNELKTKYGAKTVWVSCDVNTLIVRDTKGLYKRALLPDLDPLKLKNLTGINDVYEVPTNPDLVVYSDKEPLIQAAKKLFEFVIINLKSAVPQAAHIA
jgi:adenylylsulfate kinase